VSISRACGAMMRRICAFSASSCFMRTRSLGRCALVYQTVGAPESLQEPLSLCGFPPP
jgi:hypothetical protein